MITGKQNLPLLVAVNYATANLAWSINNHHRIPPNLCGRLAINKMGLKMFAKSIAIDAINP
jgi:hypothetical protein